MNLVIAAIEMLNISSNVALMRRLNQKSRSYLATMQSIRCKFDLIDRFHPSLDTLTGLVYTFITLKRRIGAQAHDPIRRDILLAHVQQVEDKLTRVIGECEAAIRSNGLPSEHRTF